MAADRAARANRRTLFVLTVIGSIVGVIPLALFLDHPLLILYIAVTSLFSAFFYLRWVYPTPSTAYQPRFWEIVLGGISSVYLPALSSVGSLAVWAVFLVLAWLLKAFLSWIGVSLAVQPDVIAFWPAAVLQVLMSLFLGGGGERLRAQLYPDVAGFRSAFYDLGVRKRGRLVGCAAGVFAFLGILIAGHLLWVWNERLVYMLLQFALAVVGGSLWTVGDLPILSSSALYPVKRLLEATGREVTTLPNTGDESVDPLLANIDLYADDEARPLAIQLRTPEHRPGTIDWTAASTLKTAAWTLDDVRRASREDCPQTEPVMVLVGVEVDESLDLFAGENGVRVVRLEAEDFGQIEDAQEADLMDMAHRFLDLNVGEGT